MGCSPGLYPSLRDLKAFRNLVQLLEYIFHLHVPAYPVPHTLAEILLVFLLNDENDLFKSRAVRVIHGKINDLVPLRIHRIDLLEPAVAASHTCRQNYQYRFVHFSFPFCVSFTRFRAVKPTSLNMSVSAYTSRPPHFTPSFFQVCIHLTTKGMWLAILQSTIF